MRTLSYLIVLIVLTFVVQSKKTVDEQHCEGKINSSKASLAFRFFILVCIKTVSKFSESLSEEDKSSVEKIEKAFKKFCSKVKVDSKEHRLVKKRRSFFFKI